MFSLLVIGMILIGSSTAAVSLDDSSPTADAPMCYELTLSSWRQGSGEVEPEAHWIPPKRIRLEMAPPSRAEQKKFWIGEGAAVRPDGVAPGHWIFTVGTWRKDKNGKVVVEWNGGYGSTELSFVGVRGEVRVLSDKLDERSPVAHASAIRIKCSQGDEVRGKPTG